MSSDNKVSENLKKYLESQQRAYGTGFKKDSRDYYPSYIKGGTVCKDSPCGDKYGVIGDKRYK